eukprot:TRINITY_DN61566_c0_g1_i1.p1 TRINITY_DN61566_c0_g1~~TRINITY_DN61566_c0_g1_i1.p1  ORF type:complete len:1315 (+),score=219.40 TRINITY_DN61566_c0_g1_i1:151-4095(+)
MARGKMGERIVANARDHEIAGRSPDTKNYKPLESLPIFAHREAILEHVRTHRVTHIQGETGCGKSTQVPKYIMEAAESDRKGGSSRGYTKIVVTQPRRMAAVTLARRVASELGEEVGKTVGYKISGETVSGKLCFATTGFLLQVLQREPEEFGTYSHVILDEVHERSVDADLLTLLLKLLMHRYLDVKLVVMSATLQARLFAQYFENLDKQYLRGHGSRLRAPLNVAPIFVGVRTFPVEDIFLDEIQNHFEITGPSAKRGMEKALRGFAGISSHEGKGKGSDRGKASGFMRLEPQIAEGLDELCKELIQQMARDRCTLIVFLPGIADITSFYETLAPLNAARCEQRVSSSENWRDAWTPNHSAEAVRLKIFAMHSLIPRDEQEEVFQDPPRGFCHVVLASNVAESSLTLPSVCGVIDLAMRRSIQYDARRLMSCLVTTWCSQSSCKQRSGRSGRTMPGRAVRLVTRRFFKNLVEFDPPEMLNAPLTKLYLQAKELCHKLEAVFNGERLDMNLSTPTFLLQETMQPPAQELVTAAISELAAVGCIDRPAEDALITPLGYLAKDLPCELRLCRLLYFGLICGCEADAIAIVAGLTAADPFSTPSLLVLKDEREYVKKLERSFSARQRCDRGRYSEPLMLRELFVGWIQAGAPRGPRGMGAFAREWTVIPKKFEAMVSDAVDLCTRLVKILPPRASAHAAVQRLLATMRFSVDRREELVKTSYPSASEYKSLFCEDLMWLRALLCMSFSDQMLLGLKPRWVHTAGKQKKRKEEQLVDIISEQGLNPAGTVVLLNPPHELRVGDMEDNFQKLCETLCGSKFKRCFWEKKERLFFCDFLGLPETDGSEEMVSRKWNNEGEYGWDIEQDGDPVINDICQPAHLLHQFGAGRWKFTVEHDTGDMSQALELFKPLQPFLIHWEVLQNSLLSDGGSHKAPKKPAAVKAMPDWRNPLGFACHVVPDEPQELLGVCASVQGLEAGGSAFVSGATVLGLNYFPLLLATLDVQKWQVKWCFGADGEVRRVRIAQHEIDLPLGTLTAEVLWKVNWLRDELLYALTPYEESDTETHSQSDGRKSRYQQIWIHDVSEALSSLLEEIWPSPDPMRDPMGAQQNGHWTDAAWDEVSETLTLLQPVREEAAKRQRGAKQQSQQQKRSQQRQRQQNGKPPGRGAKDMVSPARHDGANSRHGGWEQRAAKSSAGKPSGKNGARRGLHGGWENGDGRLRGDQPGRTKELDARIAAFCNGDRIPCKQTDFDEGLKKRLLDLQNRWGSVFLEEAFEHLSQWCSKRDRREVGNWTGYIVKLLLKVDLERQELERSDGGG